MKTKHTLFICILTVLFCNILNKTYGQEEAVYEKEFKKYYTIVEDSKGEKNKSKHFNITAKNQNKRLLDNSFESFEYFNTFILCYNATDEKNSDAVYLWDKTGLKLYKGNIINEADFPLESYHKFDTLNFSYEHTNIPSSFHIVKKDGKKGLFSHWKDTNKEIIPVIYDFINYEPSTKIIYAVKDKQLYLWFYSDELNQLNSIDLLNAKGFSIYKYYDHDYLKLEGYSGVLDLYELMKTNQFSEEFTPNTDFISNPNKIEYIVDQAGVQVKLFDGQYLIVQSYDEPSVLAAINPETGEDYYTGDGLPIYEYTVPQNTSGVYDLNKNKWIIDRENKWILKTYEGFLIINEDFKVELDENGKDKSTYLSNYSFMDFDEKHIFKNSTYEALSALDNYEKYLVPIYKMDSITKFDEKFDKLWTAGKYHLISKESFYFKRAWYTLYNNFPEYRDQNSESYLIYNQEVIPTKSAYEKQVALGKYQLKKGLKLIQIKNNDKLSIIYIYDGAKAIELDVKTEKVSEISAAFFDSIENSSTQIVPTLYCPTNEIVFINEYQEFLENTYDMNTGEIVFDDNGFEVKEQIIRANSGIYNYKNKEWIVLPKYKMVFAMKENYLLWNKSSIEESFIVVDSKGNVIETFKEASKIPKKYLNTLTAKDRKVLLEKHY